jgi:hypothetical protein
MRRHLDFYDYLLWTVGLLLLTLTVPVLPRWLGMGGQRKLVVAVTFFLGAMAFWAACFRPRVLRDNPTEHIDLFDGFMVASGLFFATVTCRIYLRWFHLGMTPHKMTIVAVHAFASLFAFYCIIDRGGLGKFAAICFFTGAFFLVPGLESHYGNCISEVFLCL